MILTAPKTQLQQQNVIYHHWVHKRTHCGRCKQCAKTFGNTKLPFSSKVSSILHLLLFLRAFRIHSHFMHCLFSARQRACFVSSPRTFQTLRATVSCLSIIIGRLTVGPRPLLISADCKRKTLEEDGDAVRAF